MKNFKNSEIFQAVALQLSDEADTPPTISAKGDHDLARHIVACAKKHGIPIVERPEVCSALESFDVDEAIPQELFEVAARILAEVGGLTQGDAE